MRNSRNPDTICAQIPPHGRWRHLDAGRPRVEPLIEKWKASASPPDTKEICRRLIDLFLVSVLLDAGAGNSWRYVESQSGQTFSRSEGLGVASINMFEEGFFSGNPSNPYQVDGIASIVLFPFTGSLLRSSQGPLPCNIRSYCICNAGHCLEPYGRDRGPLILAS